MVLISWLQVWRVLISCYSVMSVVFSGSLVSWLGTIATSFFTQIFSSSTWVDFEISAKALATYYLGLVFLSLICSQMEE